MGKRETVTKDATDHQAALEAIARVNRGEGPAMQDPAVVKAVEALMSSPRTKGKKPSREYQRRFKNTPPFNQGTADVAVTRTVQTLLTIHSNATQECRREFEVAFNEMCEAARVHEEKAILRDNRAHELEVANAKLKQVRVLYEQLRSAGVVEEIDMTQYQSA